MRTADIKLTPARAGEGILRSFPGKVLCSKETATTKCVESRAILTPVALALEPQVIDEPVPVTEDDFTLDGVVSPNGIVWRDGKARA